MTALEVALRITGAGLIAMSALHGLLWRLLDWGTDPKRMTPINERVFFSHLFFIVFVLLAQGALLALRPELLIEKAPLAKGVLWAFTLFYGLRLVAQPLYFDGVLPAHWPARRAIRIVASLTWATVVAVLAWALVNQYG
jgi:hypothetical protein